jgi:hypothetical protein
MDALGDAHGDRRGDRLRPERTDDRRVSTQQPGDAHGGRDRHRAAGEECCEQRHESPAQRAEAFVDRYRERHGRRAEQEMHELRALEVLRVGHIDELDHPRDQRPSRSSCARRESKGAARGRSPAPE